MIRFLIILSFPLILLMGCASVNTECEWAHLCEMLPSDNELFWVESDEDNQRVSQIIDETLSSPLTRESAVSIGLINNKELQSTFEEIGVGKADLVQAGLFKNPSLSALFLFPFSGSGTKIDATALFSLSELWLLPLRKQAAQASLEKTLFHVANMVLKTQRDLKIAYSNTFFRKILLDEAQGFYNEVDSMLTQARERHEFGYMTEKDVLNVELMKQDALIFVKEGQMKLNIESSKLAYLLGVAPCSFRLGEKMSYFECFDVDLCKFLDIAYVNRLDLKIASSDVCEKERLYELSKKMVFKDLRVGPSFEREFDGRNSMGPAFDMELPIFDQNQAQIAKAIYLLRKSKKRFLALQDEMQMLITINVQEIEYLSFKVSALNREILPLQQKVIDFAQKWNGYMQLDKLTVLDAKKELLLLNIKYWETLRELQSKIYELEYNLGGGLVCH